MNPRKHPHGPRHPFAHDADHHGPHGFGPRGPHRNGPHGPRGPHGHAPFPPELHPRHGGRRGRQFEAGHIRLLALHFLDQQPRHGYELIRAIGDLVGGDYSPSPGTVYPTLSMLEDMGLAVSSQLEDGRRQYRLTDAGRAALAEQQDELARLLERFEHGRQRARAHGVPDIRRAMENLKTALRMRLGESQPDEEAVRRMAEIIDRAAVEIGRA